MDDEEMDAWDIVDELEDLTVAGLGHERRVAYLFYALRDKLDDLASE